MHHATFLLTYYFRTWLHFMIGIDRDETIKLFKMRAVFAILAIVAGRLVTILDGIINDKGGVPSDADHIANVADYISNESNIYVRPMLVWEYFLWLGFTLIAIHPSYFLTASMFMMVSPIPMCATALYTVSRSILNDTGRTLDGWSDVLRCSAAAVASLVLIWIIWILVFCTALLAYIQIGSIWQIGPSRRQILRDFGLDWLRY